MIASKKLFLVCAATLVLFSACVDGKTHKYPSAVVDNFVNGCTKSGDSKESCTCMAEKVQAKYTYDEFIALEKKMEKGERPQEFMDFAVTAKTECSRK